MSVKESMDKEQEFLYEKFKSTGQEKVKLSCALEGFFQEKEETSEEAKNAYSQYLKQENTSSHGRIDPPGKYL